jgi:hypothetical protein
MASNLTRNAALHSVGIALVLLTVTGSSATAGQTARSKGNGAYVSASGNDASGCLWFYLSASRGGTAQAPETYVYYDIYNQCTSQWIAYGGGRVANTTLKTTKKSATLLITPTASADFHVEGIAGSLSVTWAADGLYSSTYSGHSRTEYGDHVYQSHGSWTSRSAKVAGNILGFDLGNASASLGEGRDRYMEIERGSK